MPTSSLKAPEGHYSEYEDDDEQIHYCLNCGEQLEKGDKIYVDPYIGNDNGEQKIVVSYWHAECWDAAEEK